MKKVDRHEVLRLKEEEDARLVDALPREEHDDYHIAGSLNLPLSELTRRLVAGLPRDGAIVVYCDDFQ